jgi:hypothetical protein
MRFLFFSNGEGSRVVEAMNKERSEAEEVADAIAAQRNFCAAEIFAELRAAWGVRDEDLAAAWGDASQLTVAKSGGKGGAFFVRSSRTSATLVKSLSRSEGKALAALARPYADHVLRHPASLLMRILGAYRAGTHLVILIENVLDFSGAPEAVFDVKGSVVNRRTAAGGKGTKLDCNWIDESRFVSLDEATRAALCAQAESDARVLMERNLMDYSLLVAFFPRDEASTTRAELLAEAKKREGRAYVSADGDCLYLLGIIDFLQVYNGKKKVAHALKKTLHDEALLSTVAPDLYAARFVRFLQSHVFDASFVEGALI